MRKHGIHDFEHCPTCQKETHVSRHTKKCFFDFGSCHVCGAVLHSSTFEHEPPRATFERPMTWLCPRCNFQAAPVEVEHDGPYIQDMGTYLDLYRAHQEGKRSTYYEWTEEIQRWCQVYDRILFVPWLRRYEWDNDLDLTTPDGIRIVTCTGIGRLQMEMIATADSKYPDGNVISILSDMSYHREEELATVCARSGIGYGIGHVRDLTHMFVDVLRIAQDTRFGIKTV